VVEDEMMVAWLLEDMLANLGYEAVGPAARVDQAMAIINEEAIDAAVLDMNLNGQMSYSVADALTRRNVPFVFSTGYEKARLLDSYRRFQVLRKPYRQLELRDALAKLLTLNDRASEACRRVDRDVPSPG
jgi:DNA-binding NtrC family response regulator